jgi:hypothetical protein
MCCRVPHYSVASLGTAAPQEGQLSVPASIDGKHINNE